MQYRDGTYFIGEIAVMDLVAQYGTPLFVYDAQKILSQYKRLKQAIAVPKLRINYACKALSNRNILEVLRRAGAGLDAVSIGEVRLGLLAGFEAADIVYTPNMVSMEELEAAVQAGVRINVDNIDALEYMGHHHPGVPVSIRVNPHIMAGGHSKISVGHIDSKFGISIYQLPLVERVVHTLQMQINGVHMHTGSDILDVEVFLRAADILLDIAGRFEGLEFVDFGSGFKVRYQEEDMETDIEDFGREIAARFKAFCEMQGRDITLMFEPGKFLVSEAGIFLVRTNVVKQTPSTVFAGVDSGFNHIIRPMLYEAHHDIVNVSHPDNRPRIYSVVGYICETDTFAWDRKIPEIKQGDILALKNAGAYCYSMSSNYNFRERPAEVLVHGDRHLLISRRETFEDLVRKQVDCDLDAFLG